MATVLDANAILRYLLWDIEGQAQQVKECIDPGTAVVYMPVLAEVVYVLEGVYGYSREEIDKALEALLDEVSVYDEEIVRSALRMFAMGTLDFVDCWLVARNLHAQDDILTFDKKLQRHLS